MMTLAQFDMDHWENILAVLVLVLLPLLGSLGKLLRKRSGLGEGAEEEDETLGEEIILLPPQTTGRPVPPARPLPPTGVGPPIHRRLDRPPVSPPRRPRPARLTPPPPPARPVRPAVSRNLGPIPPRMRQEHRPAEVSRESLALESIDRASLVDVHRVVAHILAGARRTSPAGITFLGRLDRDELRKAIILSEVLRPPLALRSPGSELWDT
jgi:hypothetical protein